MRFNYSIDTWEKVEGRTMAMSGSPVLVKSLYATFDFVAYDDVAKELEITNLNGNLANEGKVTFTSGSDSDDFYYQGLDFSGANPKLLNVRRASENITFAGGESGLFDEEFGDREGVMVYNTSGNPLTLGFNENITNTVGSENGIVVADGESISLPLGKSVKLFVIGAAGNIFVVEYK